MVDILSTPASIVSRTIVGSCPLIFFFYSFFFFFFSLYTFFIFLFFCIQGSLAWMLSTYFLFLISLCHILISDSSHVSLFVRIIKRLLLSAIGLSGLEFLMNSVKDSLWRDPLAMLCSLEASKANNV